MYLDDFRIVGNTLIKYTGSEDHVFVPEGVKVIGSQAFGYHLGVVSVVLPEGVVTIGESAFDSCLNLRSVTIPSSVTMIENNAFIGCRSLDNVVIPDGVSFIAAKTFFGCRSLKSVSIPEGVRAIGEEAFKRCTSLTEMAIGDKVTTLGQEAFAECTALKRVSLGKKVAKLRWSTFAHCLSLEKVAVSASLREIEYAAFDNCLSFTDLYFEGTEDEWKAVTVKAMRNTPLLQAIRHFGYTKPLIATDKAKANKAKVAHQISFDILGELPVVEKTEEPIVSQEEAAPTPVEALDTSDAVDADQIAMDLGDGDKTEATPALEQPAALEKPIKKQVERKSTIRSSQRSAITEVTDSFKKDFYERFIAMIPQEIAENEHARAAAMTDESFETQSEALFLVPAKEAYEFGCLCLFMGKYNWAFRAFLSAAGKGDLPSQFYVGSCFLWGIDTTKKIVDAARWLTKCKNDPIFGDEAKNLLTVVDEELEKPENAGLKVKRGKK